MEKREKKLVEKEVVSDIICNKCGESCKDYIDTEGKHYNFNHAVITPSFGYGSLLDSYEFEVHLCEKCYSEFESTFKIEPKKKMGLLI